MRQTLCRRLEELEKISAAAAARRATSSSNYRRVLDEMVAKAEAWHADPVNQKWLAEQPPDYLYHRVQSFRAELQERASRHFRQVQTGGFR
jgi:hypothetical protein